MTEKSECGYCAKSFVERCLESFYNNKNTVRGLGKFFLATQACDIINGTNGMNGSIGTNGRNGTNGNAPSQINKLYQQHEITKEKEKKEIIRIKLLEHTEQYLNSISMAMQVLEKEKPSIDYDSIINRKKYPGTVGTEVL